jgi:hypothetical protein
MGEKCCRVTLNYLSAGVDNKLTDHLAIHIQHCIHNESWKYDCPLQVVMLNSTPFIYIY